MELAERGLRLRKGPASTYSSSSSASTRRRRAGGAVAGGAAAGGAAAGAASGVDATPAVGRRGDDDNEDARERRQRTLSLESLTDIEPRFAVVRVRCDGKDNRDDPSHDHDHDSDHDHDHDHDSDGDDRSSSSSSLSSEHRRHHLLQMLTFNNRRGLRRHLQRPQYHVEVQHYAHPTQHQQQQQQQAQQQRQRWVDVTKASERDMDETLDLCSRLHRVTLDDIIDGDDRERVKFFDSYMVVGIQLDTSLSTDLGAIDFVTIVAFEDALYTFHNAAMPALRDLMRMVTRGLTVLKSDRLMYLILNESIRAWVPVVHAMEGEVESLQQLADVLSTADKNDFLLRLNTYHSHISVVLRKLLMRRDILKTLATQARPLVSAEAEPFFEDAMGHTVDLLRIAQSSRNALNQMQANYLAKVSLDLAVMSKQANRSVRIFTLIATIAWPISAVSGIMGMNVWTPGNVNDLQVIEPFVFTMGLIFSMTFLIVAFFKFFKYL